MSIYKISKIFIDGKKLIYLYLQLKLFTKINEVDLLSPAFRESEDIKTHSSVPLFVTKTLTWLISSEVLMIEHLYLACMILVTSPFKWHHVVTLTFDLLQGQSCCWAGDHNSPKLSPLDLLGTIAY